MPFDPLMDTPDAQDLPGGPPDQGEPVTAENLNTRIQAVSQEIRDIMQDAKANGIYNDRASLSSLMNMAKEAEDVHGRWMQQQEMSASEKDSYNPAKMISQTGGQDKGPLSGPMAPPDAMKQTNPFGGQVFNLPSPDHGKPKPKQTNPFKR